MAKSPEIGQSSFNNDYHFNASLPEHEISPELMPGRPFRVPYILGQGAGYGYSLENYALPIGWGEAWDIMRTFDTSLSEVSFFGGLRMKQRLSKNGYEVPDPPGTIEFDQMTGVLTSLQSLDPEARVSLTGFGDYVGARIPDLDTAFVLQNELIGFLNRVNANLGKLEFYPSIVGGRTGYGSENLDIPEGILNSEDFALTDLQQLKVKLKAHNIAGRFGKNLKHMEFDERGILKHISLDEGSACDYYLGSTMGGTGYLSHNVDHISQAAALHAIGAVYINGLLERLETEH